MEQAAIRSTGTRRGQTSITHLMNFSLPPRPQSDYRGLRYSGNRRTPAWGLGSGYHAVDKARYVHANYRFIVNPSGEYHAQASDADVYIQWQDILQILASAQTQYSSCPICLSTPVGPRMAKCGHIFCLPCLLRFMHSTDDTHPVPERKARWKKCPICFDSIYQSDTRPVRWFHGQEGAPPKDGEDIVLRLMTREPGSTLALPREEAELMDKREDIPWYLAAEVMDYARVIKGGETYMNTQYDQEIQDLQQQEQEDEVMFGESTEWTRKAVSLIREAKERLKDMSNPPSLVAWQEPRPPKRPPIQFNHNDADTPLMYSIQHASQSGQSSSGGESTPLPTNGTMSDGQNADSTAIDNLFNSPEAIPVNPLHRTDYHNPNAPYFFYQALVHFYLSPLDIRILKSAFGDFSFFPTSVLPRVERVSTGHIVDDNLRKRAKYLGHLPYGCEVGFLECDWTDIVPANILSLFKTDLDRRKKRHKEKENREEKERARAEKEEEDARWAAARRKRPSPTRDNFSSAPAIEAEHFETGSPPWPQSRQQNGSAFATLASPSTSPAAPRTVWGTAAVPAPSSPHLRAEIPDADLSDDGWLQGWEKDLLGADEELEFQTRASSLSAGVAVEGGEGAGSAAKKKKGKKKITLMTTNARRGA
ncbi:MAG: hypothetical protein M1814_001998 [Vezdaea aestivalis]|nr:MAG: hypothetical protein M1814_001998 [Vezdaea aestivalis]